MTDIPQHADQVRNHTRWLEGWSSGRSSFAWLLALADQPGLRNLVNQYQYALRDLPGFDPVPLEWMHILVQEVGFSDEITQPQLDALLDTTRTRLAGHGSLSLAFHRAVVLPESLALPAEPQSAITEIRAAVRDAAGSVLPGRVPDEPLEIDKHVSLAYSNADGPAVFAVATLSGTVVDPITTKVPNLSLVKFNRDHACSEWETIARIPLGD